ncbi:MAG: GIY-YIG nuclease family protein [Candidatus Omnitrophota bacterium]
MYYVYVLRNVKTQELYYGYTNDLERRLKQHNGEHERKPIYYEAYLSESDARGRERKLKHYGQTRIRLKQRLKESLR